MIAERIEKASKEILRLFKNGDARYRISKKKTKINKVDSICKKYEVSTDFIIKLLNL